MAARFHLVAIPQEKPSKMWDSSTDGTVKCTKTAGFHLTMTANMTIFIVVVKEYSVNNDVDRVCWLWRRDKNKRVVR